MAVERAAGAAPNRFNVLAGALAVASLLVILLGVLSLTRDIAELKASAGDNARALAAMRASIARGINSIDAPSRPLEGPASLAADQAR